MAGVVPSHGVPLHVGHSSIRKAVGWARRSGKPAFPSTVCWAGPAGFRVEPTVRRRLSRGASVGALAESHQPIGVAAVTAYGVSFGQGFLPIMRTTRPSGVCSGRFLAPPIRGAGEVWKRVFLQPGVLARGLCLRRCAGLKSSNRVPLGTRVVPSAGADLGDQPCCRRYGVLLRRRSFLRSLSSLRWENCSTTHSCGVQFPESSCHEAASANGIVFRHKQWPSVPCGGLLIAMRTSAFGKLRSSPVQRECARSRMLGPSNPAQRTNIGAACKCQAGSLSLRWISRTNRETPASATAPFRFRYDLPYTSITVLFARVKAT